MRIPPSVHTSIDRPTHTSLPYKHNQQTVRYWGPVPELGEGDWVGVELENPVGDTDGSYAGKLYFAAQPNHAIFVSPSIISVRGHFISSVGWEFIQS